MSSDMLFRQKYFDGLNEINQKVKIYHFFQKKRRGKLGINDLSKVLLSLLIPLNFAYFFLCSFVSLLLVLVGKEWKVYRVIYNILKLPVQF